MKKIFISQPMRDKTNDEILREREKVAKAFPSITVKMLKYLKAILKTMTPRTVASL